MDKKIVKKEGKKAVALAGPSSTIASVVTSVLVDASSTITPADLSDDELYAKCQQYGLNAKNWLRRFAGLLPEVAKRRLYRKKRFLSVQEFATKLAGMSSYAVDKILNVHSKLQNKPALLKQLESGEQGWSKIEKVAYIATPETDKEWARKVESLPQRALEICVRDYREKFTLKSEAENNPQILQPSPFHRFSFPISQIVDFELRLLKQRLEKEKKCSLSWDQVFEAVTKGEGMTCPKCAKKKTVIHLCPDCARRRALMAKGREIPAAVRQFVKAKYGEKCVFPKCKKPAKVMHHTKRFSLNKSHDLDCIVPLCKEHHDLAHAGLIENEEGPPEKWKLREKPEKNTLRAVVDRKVQRFKKNSTGGMAGNG